MKRFIRTVWTSVFVSLLLWPAVGRGSLVGSPRGAGIIVDRPPLNTGGLGADTLFNSFGSPFFERTADHILLNSTQTVEPIRRINWWGFYNENNPPVSETMRIRFYGARSGDGLPDDNNIVFEESFLNPTRTPTGRVVFVDIDPDEFMFQVDLSTPLSLTPDTPLWFEVAQIGDIDTTFRWEFSTVPSPMGLAGINPITVDWKETAFNAHNAFQLSTIPEPGSCVLFLTAALFIGHCRSIHTRLRRRPKT